VEVTGHHRRLPWSSVSSHTTLLTVPLLTFCQQQTRTTAIAEKSRCRVG